MNDEQSLLNIYNKMISSNEIEKNKSQEKLVSDLEALKKKLETSLELKQTKTRKMFSKFFSKKASEEKTGVYIYCLLYTSPSPRDPKTSRMPSSA